jgi:hypothetical protein
MVAGSSSVRGANFFDHSDPSAFFAPFAAYDPGQVRPAAGNLGVIEAALNLSACPSAEQTTAMLRKRACEHFPCGFIQRRFGHNRVTWVHCITSNLNYF